MEADIFGQESSEALARDAAEPADQLLASPSRACRERLPPAAQEFAGEARSHAAVGVGNTIELRFSFSNQHVIKRARLAGFSPRGNIRGQKSGAYFFWCFQQRPNAVRIPGRFFSQKIHTPSGLGKRMQPQFE